MGLFKASMLLTKSMLPQSPACHTSSAVLTCFKIESSLQPWVSLSNKIFFTYGKIILSLPNKKINEFYSIGAYRSVVYYGI
jgi:hypothetical protein